MGGQLPPQPQLNDAPDHCQNICGQVALKSTGYKCLQLYLTLLMAVMIHIGISDYQWPSDLYYEWGLQIGYKDKAENQTTPTYSKVT